MNEVVWDESSCCGSNHSGTISFPDGEVVYLTELEEGTKFFVRAIKNFALNTESTRIPGGENMAMTVAEFNKLLAT